MKRPIQQARALHRADLVERIRGKGFDEPIDRRGGSGRELAGRGGGKRPSLREAGGVHEIGQRVAPELHRSTIARELLEPSRGEPVPEGEMREGRRSRPTPGQLDAPTTQACDHRRQAVARCAIARGQIARHLRSESRNVLSVATLSAVAASESMTTNALSWA